MDPTFLCPIKEPLRLTDRTMRAIPIIRLQQSERVGLVVARVAGFCMFPFALAFFAFLGAGPVHAQNNPLIDFWLNPFGGASGSSNSDQSRYAPPPRTGTAGVDQGAVYRSPRQDTRDALWDAPFDPGGAQEVGLQDDFADSPQPVDPNYRIPVLSEQTVEAVKAAIARYRQIVVSGGWAAVPPGAEMQIGTQDPRVAVLRARLEATGDLRQRGGRADAYDSFVYQAVVKFQRRHGLRPNGRVDDRTLSALNVPARARLSQLTINLERIVKLRSGLSDRYVMVNIPGAEIEAVANGVVESRHRAVVGALDRPTPIVQSQIVELNFYPYWHVPESIVKRDLVPTIREDFDYLHRTNLRVFTDWGYKNELDPQSIDWNSDEAMNLKFRQEPGDGNALGYVKINFPNEHQVYLHDTPKRRLFGEELRAYSSGCVRVQNVDDLVAWLLSGQDDWSGERVQEVIQSAHSQDVGLKKKVQLHMTYVTAWASVDGMVHFRRDLYGRDGVGELAANY